MAGPFQRDSHFMLMRRATAGSGAVEDFGVRRHKTPQELDIFIIHGRDFVLAKVTGLGLEKSVVFGKHNNKISNF